MWGPRGGLPDTFNLLNCIRDIISKIMCETTAILNSRLSEVVLMVLKVHFVNWITIENNWRIKQNMYYLYFVVCFHFFETFGYNVRPCIQFTVSHFCFFRKSFEQYFWIINYFFAIFQRQQKNWHFIREYKQDIVIDRKSNVTSCFGLFYS